MKAAFEKLREDVGEVSTWGSNNDGQLGRFGEKPSRVELRGIIRQAAYYNACGSDLEVCVL